MAVRIQMRRDTGANWTLNDPILAEGEMGLEKDTGRWKIGNGTAHWTELSYSNEIFSGPSVISGNSEATVLRINQTGIGNAFVVEDDTNPDQSPFVISSTGNVGIGKLLPTVLLDVNGDANISGTLSSTTASADTNTTQVATTAFVVGQAGTALPLIDGTAATGTSLRYSRQDHKHPTDTTRASIDSPTFTGIPAAPTAAVNTNTTQLATTAFVVGQASSSSPLMNGTVAIGTSLRYARADHVHPSDTSKANLNSPQFTGIPSVPTAPVDSNTEQIANTAFVISQGYAKLDSPSFIGTPTAPTAPVDTNTTQIATTEFVIAQNYLTTSTAESTYATKTISTNIKTTSYTLTTMDNGSVIEIDSSDATSVTIPLNSYFPFPIGFTVDVVQVGSGSVSINVDDPSLTIQSKNGLTTLSGQYSAATLYKRDTNTWILIGDLA